MLEVRGEPGIGKTRLLVGDRRTGPRPTLPGAHGPRLGARAATFRSPRVADALTGALSDASDAVGRCSSSAATSSPRSLGDDRRRGARWRQSATAPTRAVAALLGALTTAPPAGAGARRPALGRRRLARAARLPAAPAARRAAGAGAVAPPAPGAGVAALRSAGAPRRDRARAASRSTPRDVAALFADLDIPGARGPPAGRAWRQPAGARAAGHAPAAGRGVAGGAGRRARALPPEAAALARGAAVAVATRSTSTWPARSPGSTSRRVLDALDELAARDLVRAETVPRRFRFRHPVLRRGGLRGRSGRLAARGAPHRRAQALEPPRRARSPPRPTTSALSATVGDETAMAVLQRPARPRRRCAPPATAARWYWTPRCGSSPSDEASPRRLDLLARGPPRSARRRPAAPRAATRCTRCWPPCRRAGRPARARAVGSARALEHLLGHHAEARALLLDALADGRPTCGPGRRRSLRWSWPAGALLRGDFAGRPRTGLAAPRAASPAPTTASCIAAAPRLAGDRRAHRGRHRRGARRGRGRRHADRRAA